MAYFRIVDKAFSSKIREARQRDTPQIRGDQMDALAARVDNVRKSGTHFSGRDFERMIGRSDLLPVNYLERGVRAAKAVGRIGRVQADLQGSFWGTGFLISPHLLITNNHVIETDAIAANAVVEFDYQRDARGNLMPPRRFRLDPGAAFFWSLPKDLDYTVIAVVPMAMNGDYALADQGFLRLNPSLHKVEEHEFVSLIQHPGADEKYVSIRENKVVQIGAHGLAVPDRYIWYTSDTSQGSSGAPVMTDEWQVVALHHAGVAEAKEENGRKLVQLTSKTWIDAEEAELLPDDAIVYEANEGVRVSYVLNDLRTKLAAEPNQLVQALFDDIDGVRPFAGVPRLESVATPVVAADSRLGTVAPASALERKPKANRYDPSHFDGRKGYDPAFLGKPVALPTVTQRALSFGRIAEVAGRSDGELKYEHFSIIFNADRRLAFYTAVNIDGALSVALDRGQDKWYFDPRLPEAQQIGDDFYTNEPGPSRNYFDRGHLVRRLDPVWGAPDEVLRANSDTFVFTNCSPQYFTFNQTQAFWQGLENYILNNTDGDNLKASVFTGPVFIDDEAQQIAGEVLTQDEIHRGVAIPQAFWKVVVVSDATGRLFSSAYIVSQAQWAKNIPFERLPVGQFNNFQVSVAQLERITGLQFDPIVSLSDVGRTMTRPEKLRGLADIRHPRRDMARGYGMFESFEAFLESYERARAGLEAETLTVKALEKKKKLRERDVVEITAEVAVDQGTEGLHQHLLVTVRSVELGDKDVADDLQRVIAENERVFVAIRFGDHLGLAQPVPGLSQGVSVRLKGEWIPRDKAYMHGGEKMSVIHFTHHPLGYVCTPTQCYD